MQTMCEKKYKKPGVDEMVVDEMGINRNTFSGCIGLKRALFNFKTDVSSNRDDR